MNMKYFVYTGTHMSAPIVKKIEEKNVNQSI